MLQQRDDDAVAELVGLADGDPQRLYDARALLHSISLEPDAEARAVLIVERAITRVDESARQATRSRDLRRTSKELKRHSASLRTESGWLRSPKR